MSEKSLLLVDENATISLGQQLACLVKNKLSKGIVVYLHGDLGAGKTTFTRGFVTGMGHSGNVKSPTYTLVEPYELPPWRIFHFDLYRLADPEELEFMGIRDYFDDDCCCFIEWPDKGKGVIAEPDLVINIAYSGEQRTINFQPLTENGQIIVTELAKQPQD